MKFNPVSDIINAFAFRKWSSIARQNDLILSQDSNGKFTCTDVDGGILLSQAPTAQEAVNEAIHFGMRSNLYRGV
jgi:hypothetical protein